MFGFVKNKNIVLIRFFIGLFSFPWRNILLNPYMVSGAGLKAITGGDKFTIDLKHKQSDSCKILAIV